MKKLTVLSITALLAVTVLAGCASKPKAGAKSESKKYFTQMADGTYQLISDAETFYNTFKSDKRQELIDELNRKKDFGIRDTSADERQILGMATSWSDIDETQLQVGEEDVENVFLL